VKNTSDGAQKSWWGWSISLFVFLWSTITPAQAQVEAITFNAPPIHSGDIGTIPLGVAMGDFNGDGLLDFVVAEVDAANSTIGQIVFYTGNSDGSFTSTGPIPVNGTIAGQPYGTNHIISVGHFNGPGQPLGVALALTNSSACGAGGPGVYIMYSMPAASGGASVATCTPTAAAPTSLAVGDFNGDGFDDVAVSNPSGSASGTASVYLNVANSTNGQSGLFFYANYSVQVVNTAPSNVTLYGTIVAGNLGPTATGPGLALLASYGLFSQYVDVLLPFIVKSGLLPPVLTFSWADPAAAAPSSGLNDIAIVAPSGTSPPFVYGIGLGGAYSFAVTNNLPYTATPILGAATLLGSGAYINGYALTTADFDGNGITDFAFLDTHRTLGIALNSPVTSSLPIGPFGPEGQALATGFSTGLNKWVIVDAGIFQKTTPLFTQVSEARSIAAYLVDPTSGQPAIAPLFDQSRSYVSTTAIPAFAVADLNGDGAPDVVVLGEDQASFAATITPFENVFATNVAGFVAQPVTDLGGGSTLTGSAPLGYAVVAGKFRNATTNPSGLPDLVLYSGQGITLLENLGAFAFALDTNCVGGFSPTATNCYLATEKHFPGLPTSSLNAVPPIIAADVNGDGIDDVVMAVPENCNAFDLGGVRAAIYVFISNGDGTFKPPVYYASPVVNPVALAAGKVLASGFPDIVVANGGESCLTSLATPSPLVALALLPNNHDGTGSFGAATTVLTQTTVVHYPNISSLAVADMNLDGIPDIVYSGNDGLHVMLSPSSVFCCFTDLGAVPLYGVADPSIQNASQIAIADFNRDGSPDVAAVIGGSAYLFPNSGTGALYPPLQGYSSGANSSQAVAIDVNGDGAPDLLVSNSAGFAAMLSATPAGIPIGSPAHLIILTTNLGSTGSTTTAGIAVSNIGPLNATNVVVTYKLPAGLQFVSSTASPTGSSPQCVASTSTQVVCSLGSMAAGSNSPVLQIVVASTVPQTASYSSTFTATSAQPEGTPASDNTITTVFTVSGALAPVLTSVSPNTGIRGQDLMLTLSGSNFTNIGTSVGFGNAGISVVPGTLNILNATSATATVAIATNAPVGSGTVTLSTYVGQSSLTNGFNVTTSAPAPVTITIPETVTVSDGKPLLSDVSLIESVHVLDRLFVTPLANIAGPIAYFSSLGLGFGNSSGTQTVTVSNVGRAPFTLSSVSPPSDPAFQISQVICLDGSTSLPDTLIPASTCSFTINYTAPTIGATNASITFTDSSGLSNLASTRIGTSFTQTLLLSGSGATTTGGAPPSTSENIGTIPEVVLVSDGPPAVSDIALPPEVITVSDTVSVNVLNTLIGNGIVVTPIDLTTGKLIASVAFANVTSAGITTVTSGISVAAAPANFSAACAPQVTLDISTTAAYSGGATVCVNPAALGASCAANSSLMHYSGGLWQPLPAPAVVPAGQICGVTPSFSPFAAFAPSQQPQSITFTSTPVVTVGATAPILATGGGSGNAITYVSNTTAACSVSGSTVTGIAAGTNNCIITASQAGNSSYSAAPAVILTFSIGQGTQTINVGALANQIFGATPIALPPATASSGLPVSFASTTPAVCAVAGSTVTIIAAGSCTIQASQAGSSNYSAAPNLLQTFSIAPVVPGAPTIGNAVASNLSATVAFTVPTFTGGVPISMYTVTSTPGGVTATGAASPITVGGLTSGTSYSFTVTATNAAGIGAPSQSSNAVVLGIAPTITSQNAVTFIEATTASFTLAATGLPTPALSIVGALPAGVSFNATTGALGGTPTASGTYPLMIAATNSIGTTSQSFTLTVNASTAQLSPSSLAFANQQTKTVSPTQVVTLINVNAAAIKVGGISTSSGNFAVVSTNCGKTLAPHSDCAINVSFQPESAGAKTATLSVGAHGTVALSGTGVAPSASLTPSAWNFGNEQVGTTSAAEIFAYNNTGIGPIAVAGVSIGGSNESQFAVASNGCAGITLPPGATCNFAASFTPSAMGAMTAYLTVRDTAGGVARTVEPILGVGIGPAISLGSGIYRLGAVTVPTSATFTLNNSGTAPFAIGAIAFATGTHFHVSGGTCTAGATVNAASSCNIAVTFTPSGTTTFSDTLTVLGTGIGDGAASYSTMRAMSGH
jgi:uncharacterized repeat protein (TIGR01451 family)